MKESKFVKYHPEIPPIPPHLQELAKTVLVNENVSRFGDLFDDFCIYEPPEELEAWAKEYFDLNLPFKLNVRTIKNGMPPHLDSGIESVTSFLIETGGDVHTTWHASMEVGSEIIEEHVLPKGVWHTIDVASPHSVSNIEPNKLRIMVSIAKISPTGLDFEGFREQAKNFKKYNSTHL